MVNKDIYGEYVTGDLAKSQAAICKAWVIFEEKSE